MEKEAEGLKKDSLNKTEALMPIKHISKRERQTH
jgi:hypothetical protein